MSQKSVASKPDYGQHRLRGSYPHHSKPQACAKSEVEVLTPELPFCCPQPGQRVWDAHPRVYLPLDAKKPRQVCPYCGTTYRLVCAQSNADDAPMSL